MAKKEKIALSRSDRLEEIDTQLEAAMSDLDATNARIDVMLSDESFRFEAAAGVELEPEDEGDSTPSAE